MGIIFLRQDVLFNILVRYCICLRVSLILDVECLLFIYCGAAPKPSFHDFVLPKGDAEVHASEKATGRYLFGICLTLWRQKSTLGTPNAFEADAIGKEPSTPSQYCPQFVTVVTTEPMHKKSRRLLLQLASGGMVRFESSVLRVWTVRICSNYIDWCFDILNSLR